MTLAGQIVCSDSARWGVQREFNRRVKIAFQKEGIRMMPVNTTVTALQRPFEIKMAPSGKATPAAYAMPDSEKG
jgi:small conductance mechanosensitive channel